MCKNSLNTVIVLAALMETPTRNMHENNIGKLQHAIFDIFRDNRLFPGFEKFRWKMNYFRDMKEFKENGYSLPDLLFELLSKERKKRNFDFWEKIPRNIAKTKYGIDFHKDTPDCAMREIFFNGIYVSYEDFLPDENSVVVDVGAQYGDYSLMCGKYFKAREVTCFEPLDFVYKILDKNVKLNGLTNVHIRNIALSDREGYIKAWVENDMATKGTGSSSIHVKTSMLDSEISGQVDILKIDVEGFEMEVLEGARETIDSSHPKIIIEVHSHELKSKTIEFLKNFDYQIAHEGRKLTRKENGMDLIQNLYFY